MKSDYPLYAGGSAVYYYDLGNLIGKRDCGVQMDMNDATFRRTVLVVEDEPVNSQLLGFILSEE